MLTWDSPEHPKLDGVDLCCLPGLVSHYRNLWLEADFVGDHMAPEYEKHFNHYQNLLTEKLYENEML